jgi:hypothetical protein
MLVSAFHLRYILYAESQGAMKSQPQASFERRTTSESICLKCFATVRANRSVSLEEAEKDHLA